MDSKNKLRAHRKNIANEILNILNKTAHEYGNNGDPESDLRDAPEYLLTVDVARGLVNAFPNLRYRLEKNVNQFLGSAINEVESNEKPGARFDIVLIRKTNLVPRFVIELKRGQAVYRDAKRILRIAAMDHGRPSWQYGFLVTLVRRSEGEAQKLLERIETKLQGALKNEKPSHSIKIRSAFRKIGESSRDPSAAVCALVFEISVGDLAEADVDN